MFMAFLFSSILLLTVCDQTLDRCIKPGNEAVFIPISFCCLNPHLSRDVKACLILSELRKRLKCMRRLNC